MRNYPPSEQALRGRLDRIPVLKLPPSKLDACLKVLASTPSERRREVVRKITTEVYPGFSPKRAFRALVAPALTRLHFARSEPPAFRLAPNGKIWRAVDESIKQAYVSVTLFDFAKIRLGLNPSILPPTGSLRETARQFGAMTLDRVRGLDHMLRFYLKFHPCNWTQETFNGIGIKLEVAEVAYFEEHSKKLEEFIHTTFSRKRIIGIDEARYCLMEKMLSQNVLSSSFVADEWLKACIRTMTLNVFRSAYTTIDSLIIGGHPINAIMLS